MIDGHAYHLYVIEVDDRKGLYNYLRSKGIFPQIHYIPTHLMPYYQSLGYNQGDFPNAEKICNQVLSFPHHQYLTEREIKYVSQCINNFYA